MLHKGSCHCGGVTFEFIAPEIKSGVRCNCSICRRKGAVMTDFTLDPTELKINAEEGILAVYEFGSGIAHHYFCKQCGIYPFHQTMRKKGQYRINLGCLDHVDALSVPYELFDGAAI